MAIHTCRQCFTICSQLRWPASAGHQLKPSKAGAADLSGQALKGAHKLTGTPSSMHFSMACCVRGVSSFFDDRSVPSTSAGQRGQWHGIKPASQSLSGFSGLLVWFVLQRSGDTCGHLQKDGDVKGPCLQTHSHSQGWDVPSLTKSKRRSAASTMLLPFCWGQVCLLALKCLATWDRRETTVLKRISDAGKT